MPGTTLLLTSLSSWLMRVGVNFTHMPHYPSGYSWCLKGTAHHTAQLTTPV